MTASALVLSGFTTLAKSQRVCTPRQTDGSFHPVDWSGDIDHDLVAAAGEAARARKIAAQAWDKETDARTIPGDLLGNF